MSHAILLKKLTSGTSKPIDFRLMSNMRTLDNLLAQIPHLPFSESFKAKSRKMGFDTLQEIVDLTQKELRSTDGFDYIWFDELLDYLHKNDALHLLEN